MNVSLILFVCLLDLLQQQTDDVPECQCDVVTVEYHASVDVPTPL